MEIVVCEGDVDSTQQLDSDSQFCSELESTHKDKSNLVVVEVQVGGLLKSNLEAWWLARVQHGAWWLAEVQHANRRSI